MYIIIIIIIIIIFSFICVEDLVFIDNAVDPPSESVKLADVNKFSTLTPYEGTDLPNILYSFIK